MTLDFAVAQALFAARQAERALHDRGPWEVRIGSLSVPACKIIAPNRVVFFAHFPEHCWLQPPVMAELLCRGEVVGTKALDEVTDAEFAFEWHITVGGLTPVNA